MYYNLCYILCSGLAKVQSIYLYVYIIYYSPSGKFDTVLGRLGQ